MNNILVLATSRKSHGGISSVVMAHERGEQWKDMGCHWVVTHRSGSKVLKMWYFVTGMISFLVRVPFCKLVHIHTSEPPSAKRKRIFMHIAKIMGKKVIVHFHAFDTASTICSSSQSVYRYLFSNADVVIALSPTWKRAINEVFALGDKVQVLYNPCPIIPISKLDVVKKKQILSAGVINARKGYKDLIMGFSKIANYHHDWYLVFAGSGEIGEGKILAKELGIEKQVEFLGWVAGTDKDRVFRETSVFCLPSYAEGFPMAVLDAWAYNLPVVATPVGGLPDIVKDGEDCLLFTPGDSDQLAEQLERMITDSELREKIIRASRKMAEKVFNENVINRQLAEIYASLSK